ncbi:MAG: hypothetical protein K2J30_00960 [Clostridia bacterium]|nr:hypothetical protein [Clostridia bacterium]
MKEVRLTMPLSGELMTTVRLTTGGVCSVAGLSMDDGEDCKVCVTESLLLLMHRGYNAAQIVFTVENGLGVEIEGQNKTERESAPQEDEISAAILCALAENAVLEKKDGELSRITFRFGLQA